MDYSPSRLICPWNFPGNITREGCHFLLQGIFSTDLGIKPASPAFTDGFFTPEPPEKLSITFQFLLTKQPTTS